MSDWLRSLETRQRPLSLKTQHVGILDVTSRLENASKVFATRLERADDAVPDSDFRGARSEDRARPALRAFGRPLWGLLSRRRLDQVSKTQGGTVKCARAWDRASAASLSSVCWAFRESPVYLGDVPRDARRTRALESSVDRPERVSTHPLCDHSLVQNSTRGNLLESIRTCRWGIGAMGVRASRGLSARARRRGRHRRRRRRTLVPALRSSGRLVFRRGRLRRGRKAASN